MEKGTIEKCKFKKDQFLSPYLLSAKLDGTDRFILNLKNVNEFITYNHFKLEDIRTTAKIIYSNYKMCNLDLQDAYFLVPVNKNYRKYHRFKFNKRLY